jgi:hypothetical protein
LRKQPKIKPNYRSKAGGMMRQPPKTTRNLNNNRIKKVIKTDTGRPSLPIPTNQKELLIKKE